MARNGFYVDDLIAGTDNLDTALSLQQDLIDMLKKGGFTLRKWTSNQPAPGAEQLRWHNWERRLQQPENIPSTVSISIVLIAEQK